MVEMSYKVVMSIVAVDVVKWASIGKVEVCLFEVGVSFLAKVEMSLTSALHIFHVYTVVRAVSAPSMAACATNP